MTARRTIRALVLVLGFLASSFAFAAAAQPAAAAPCSGTGCNGRDAAICGGDARTIDSFRSGNVLIELRYSPSCNAAWARGSGNPGDTCWGWLDCKYVQLEGSNGTVYRQRLDGASWRTPMLSFTYYVRACQVTERHMQSSLRSCTAWR